MNRTAVGEPLAPPSLWTRLVAPFFVWAGRNLIGRPRHGAVTLNLPNGKSYTFGNPATGLHPTITIRNFKVLSETLRRGTVGFAQTYIDGLVEVDDLTALFRYFLQNRDVLDPPRRQLGSSALRRISRITCRARTPKRAARRTSPSTTTSATTSTASGSTLDDLFVGAVHLR
jgi:hypothetical protein